VLQRRHNHETFVLRHVDCDLRPDLAARFAIEHLPALVVVEDKRVRGKAERPNGCAEIRSLLAPWLK
jgi:hypothetical protein